MITKRPMKQHDCKKPFLCSCEVEELAERASDRMMDYVKEHFKQTEQPMAIDKLKQKPSIRRACLSAVDAIVIGRKYE